MTRRSTLLLWVAVAAVCGLYSAQCARAQMNDSTLELFHKIMPSLDEDLRSKFQGAIDSDRTWIEFEVDEFLRFREHPANPFDGLDAIDPKQQPGKIRLEFKVPSPRDRIPISRERQHHTTLQHFQSSTAGIAPSVARVLRDDKWIAMATAVGANGLLVTKASEVRDSVDVICRFYRDGQPVDYPAKVARVDDSNDLALLRIEGLQLTPVAFYREPIHPGQFVAACDEQGTACVMGVVSTSNRCLTSINQAYLGVRPVNATEGVELVHVTPGGAAEVAGLRTGDVITRLNERPIKSVADLVNAIRLHRPGTSITIDYLRDGNAHQVSSELAARNIQEKRVLGKSKTVAGAIVSARHNDFPLVFQHDAPLLPEHCGGPLVDLNGHVLGINIARAGRVASFAICGPQVEQAIDRLLRENVASLD